MTATLFDAVLALGSILGGMRTSTATGGSTTTIVDTKRPEPDNVYVQGTALVIYDAGGAGAAPEGEWGVISAYASDTATIPTLTAAVAAGDRYAIIPPRYPLDMLIDKINLTLTSILVPAYDATSLDTVAGQTEYTLPAAVTRNNLRRVFVQTDTGTSNNLWLEVRDWSVIRKGTGTQDVLVFGEREASRDIRLDYVTQHSPIYLPTDTINEAVHMDRIIYQAAAMCILEKLSTETGDRTLANRMNYFESKADEARVYHPVITSPINSKINIAAGFNIDP